MKRHTAAAVAVWVLVVGVVGSLRTVLLGSAAPVHCTAAAAVVVGSSSGSCLLAAVESQLVGLRVVREGEVEGLRHSRVPPKEVAEGVAADPGDTFLARLQDTLSAVAVPESHHLACPDP